MRKIILLFICMLFICSCSQNKTEFYCEEGTLEGSRCKIVSTAEAKYACKEGFNFNDETKKCENIISVDASYDIVCSEGFYLENGKCISENNLPYNNGVCSGSIYNGMCKEIRYRYKAYHCLYGTLNTETNKCDFVDGIKPNIECPAEYKYNEKSASCEIFSYVDALERIV